MTYKELQKALQVLNLSERATLKEIKARFRLLAKQHHPDRSEEGDPETIRRINAAYRILLEYCSDYRFCFTREEFFEQYPEERLRHQFMPEPPLNQEDE